MSGLRRRRRGGRHTGVAIFPALDRPTDAVDIATPCELLFRGVMPDCRADAVEAAIKRSTALRRRPSLAREPRQAAAR
jgi:hypothetical protein